MDEDAFDNLLGLEDGFYQEGYGLGLADGAHAGLVEGKLFGIEQGFQKALEMGRLSGRAQIWSQRLSEPGPDSSMEADSDQGSTTTNQQGQISVTRLSPLSKNTRLGRHVEALMTNTNTSTLSRNNSDEAVAEFDERLTRANAKAKVIANVVAEHLDVNEHMSVGKPKNASQATRSIEEASNLSARH